MGGGGRAEVQEFEGIIRRLPVSEGPVWPGWESEKERLIEAKQNRDIMGTSGGQWGGALRNVTCKNGTGKGQV